MPPKSWFRQLLGRDVDKTDFITRTRENSLPDIAVLVQIYNEKLHSQLKKNARGI